MYYYHYHWQSPHSINHLINQSINQSINQAINQSISHWINSITCPLSIKWSLNQSTTTTSPPLNPHSTPTKLPPITKITRFKLSIIHSINPPVYRPINHPISPQSKPYIRAIKLYTVPIYKKHVYKKHEAEIRQKQKHLRITGRLSFK